MKPILNRKEATEAKVCFVLTITALFLQELANGVEPEGTVDNPAVSLCTQAIDEYLRRHNQERRNIMIVHINHARVRLTKDVKNMDIANAVVGCLRSLTGNLFLSTPGTAFDFIRQNFRDNLKSIEDTMKIDQKQVAKFQRSMRNSLDRI